MLAIAVGLQRTVGQYRRILTEPSSGQLSGRELVDRSVPVLRAATSESARFTQASADYRQASARPLTPDSSGGLQMKTRRTCLPARLLVPMCYPKPVPGTVFTGHAPFGFTFSCEDKGGLNPPTGELAIELAYADQGTSPLLGAPFGIHGIVDTIDLVLESAICIGQNPPPDGSTLIFLGRYRPTTSRPSGFPATCPSRETKTTPLCRFEVIVRDNTGNLRNVNLARASTSLSHSTPTRSPHS
jgi:hypothetical protein